jgi:hypothetical protein
LYIKNKSKINSKEAVMFSKEKTITVTVDDYKSRDAVYSREFEGREGHACLVEVLPDNECYDSPRDWDNLWTWVTTQGAGYSDNGQEITDYEDDNGKLRKDFLRNNLVMPLYLYRHSGDVISMDSFAGRGLPQGYEEFDSGCMGFAFVSKEKIKKEYNCVRITKSVLEKARQCLKGEVETMNMLNMGEVYSIKVVDMVTDCEHSVYGFYCANRNEIADCAKDVLAGFAQEGEERYVAERLVA